MLEMDERRFDYVSALRPEEGYALHSAVATTYSLDLSALLGVCMSLADMDFSGDPTNANRVGVFAAVGNMRDKISVFCEKGRIKNDEHTRTLCILLEGLVHQVVVKKPTKTGNNTTSFHPKVWILDYVNNKDGKHAFRLVVLSRNLTFDGSWDIAACLDGDDTGKPVPESEGLISFLEYLREARGVEKDAATKKRIRNLQKALKTVRFNVDNALYDKYEFLPLGPKGSRLLDAGDTKLLADKHDNALIVSPFLGNTGPLERLADNRTNWGQDKGRFLLVSREESLYKLNEGLASKYELCAPKSWLADVDLEEDEVDNSRDEMNAATYSDLHAKIYVTEDSSNRNLYIGSMNASYNGMSGNVESLLRLHIKKRVGLFNEIVESLIGDKKPFGAIGDAPQSPLPEVVQSEEECDRRFHNAVKLFVFRSVQIGEKTRGKFSIAIEYELDAYEGLLDDIDLTITPYLADGKAYSLTSGPITIDDLNATQISEYFILACKGQEGFKRSCLIRCPSEVFHDEVLNSESRTKLLLDRILSSDDNALSEYISFAFGFSKPLLPGDTGKTVPIGVRQTSCSIAPGMYEQLLKALSEDNEAQARLEHARRMIEFLPEKYDDDQIEAMRNLIDQFESAVQHRGRR